MAEISTKYINFEYDTNLIGSTDKDSLYVDPNDTNNIWPEGHIRISTAQWVDSNLGINGPDRTVRLETFDGKIHKSHVIKYYTPEELEKEPESIRNAPLMKSFIQSPFYDVEAINKETSRLLEAVNKTSYEFHAWRTTFDPDEFDRYEQWKKEEGDEDAEARKKYLDDNTVWGILSNSTTEDLFKFKLDIFEQSIVQNSESKELRSKIRKAKSICEVCAAYQELLDSESPDGTVGSGTFSV